MDHLEGPSRRTALFYFADPMASRPKAPLSPPLRTAARAFYWTHLWLGVLLTLLTLLVGVTGVLLNHKRALGLMPDPQGPGALPLGTALGLGALEERARSAVASLDGAVDRMDVRPGDGLVKVRFDDAEVHEVTLALEDGRVLHVGRRGDVFMERLHSGEIFGDGWILLSDATAVGLVLLVVSGLWLWLFPRFRA